ncbi:MAG: glycosyltransferase family 4 protein [Paludibacteraceae bacterium]|nr:glycosyltransferase family 4 protein [Paludibacteraceae bacterium]
MKRILFYSSTQDKRMFSIQSFYQNDIRILKDLGYEVILSNRLRDFLRFSKYDDAFIYFYRYGLFGALIAKIARKRVFFTGGIDYMDKNFANRRQRFIQRLFFRLCYRLSNKCFVVSTSDMANIRQMYSHQPVKCVVCPHVIDVHSLQYSPEKQKKKKQFLTMAWMGATDNVYRKGVDRAIYIFEIIHKRYPEYTLYIAGPGGRGSALVESIIWEKHLEDSIKLLGAVSEEEKNQLMLESAYYFQISTYEGFGIAAAEALAANCMVIHSGRGGLADAVGSHGLLVEDIDDFEAAAQLIMDDMQYDNDENRRKRQQNGALYVAENFAYSRRLGDFRTHIGDAHDNR